MSKKERKDSGRRDSQPEQEQRRTPDQEMLEGESLAALKAILAKVASLLKPLKLDPDESIRLVEQLYGDVLEMDMKLAGEADDARKSSVLSHVQNAVVRREKDSIVVEYPKPGKGSSKKAASSKSGS